MMTIDQNVCIRCASCVSTCPAGIFKQTDDGSITALQQPCLDCFHCTAVCPVQAIGHHELSAEVCYPTPASNNTLLGMLQRRHSYRHFKPETPDRARILNALNAASCAPSAKNQRCCEWTVVLGREKVEELYRLGLSWAKGQHALRHLVWVDRQGRNPVTCGAPCLILAHCPADCSNPPVEGAIAAVYAEQLLVDAGLGTCWGGYMCHIANHCPEVNALLRLPEGHQVQAVLMVGFPDEHFRAQPYRPAAAVHWLE